MLLRPCSASEVHLLLVLFFFLVTHTPFTAAASNSTTLLVAPEDAKRPVVLQSLFNVQLDSIDFSQVPSFTLFPEAWTYVSADTPYVLNRNFSIWSQHQPATVMDWSLLDGKVLMQPGISFVLDSLVLVNTRSLNTFFFDWFANSPGAVLEISNSIMVDPVCNASSPDEDLAAAQSLPQLPRQPRPNSVRRITPFCLRLPNGTECFPHGVQLQALAVVLDSASRTHREIATSAGAAARASTARHFVVRYSNTTRVCRRYLEDRCLQEHDGDRTYCWQQAAQAVFGAGAAAAAGGGPPAGVIAGAVVGGVVGLLALLAAIFLLVRRRRRHHGPGSLSSKQHAASLLGGSRDGSRPSSHLQQDPPQADRSVRGTLQGEAAGAQLLPQQSGDRMSSFDNPAASFGRDGLTLGRLLGVGSYGRVYHGRWHGREVAVKIIHCLPEELQRVLREAEIMLQLDHPNVVRALNCIVQQGPADQTAPAQRARVRSGGSSSGGGGSGSRTASSIDRMLPVLGAAAATSLPSGHSTQLAAVGHAPAGSLDGSAAGSGPHRPAQAAGDAQLLKQQQQQGPAGVQQQEVQVLPVLTSGSELEAASSSTPERQQPPPQQQQQVGMSGSGDAEDADGSERVAEVWLVLELCMGGNLQDSFKHRGDAFDMARLLCRLAEVAQGMVYLHSRQILHGDLKSANVLLVNSIHGTFGQIAKLSDFGLAGVLREGVTHRSTQNLGTVSHCAPEVLQDGRVSPASDVFSFGMMMWELLTSSTAYKGEHYGNILQQVVAGRRPALPADTPEDYALLMQACWAADPADRPTFQQVLECLTIMLQSLDSTTSSSSTAANNPSGGSGRLSQSGTAVAGGGGEDGLATQVASAPAAAVAVPLAAGDGGRASSSKVGSFDVCRPSSLGSLQQGTTASSTLAAAGPAQWQAQSAASRGSSDLDGGPTRSMGAWYARKGQQQQPTQPPGPPSHAMAAAAVAGGTGSGVAGTGPQGFQSLNPGSAAAPGSRPSAQAAGQDAAAVADQPRLPESGPGSSTSSGAFTKSGSAAAAGAQSAGTGVQQPGPAMLAARVLGAAGGEGHNAVHKGGSAGSGGSSRLSQLQAPTQSKHIQDL